MYFCRFVLPLSSVVKPRVLDSYGSVIGAVTVKTLSVYLKQFGKGLVILGNKCPDQDNRAAPEGVL